MLVVSWGIPKWVDHKGTLPATEVNVKKLIGSPGTGMHSQGSPLLEWKTRAGTQSINNSLGCYFFASFQIFDFTGTVPKGFLFVCFLAGRGGPCCVIIGKGTAFIPAKCTDSGFQSGSSLSQQLLDPDRPAVAHVW